MLWIIGCSIHPESVTRMSTGAPHREQELDSVTAGWRQYRQTGPSSAA
jgi:hypothetical protein